MPTDDASTETGTPAPPASATSRSTADAAGSAAKPYDGTCRKAAPASQEDGTTASSAAAARSGYLVRSPSPSPSPTIVPVRPRRCTRTSTPRPASSAHSMSPAGSAPTQPMNRAGTALGDAADANAATFAALPPLVRWMTAGLSVACLAGDAGQTTTSSTRSPTVTRTPAPGTSGGTATSGTGTSGTG